MAEGCCSKKRDRRASAPPSVRQRHSPHPEQGGDQGVEQDPGPRPVEPAASQPPRRRTLAEVVSRTLEPLVNLHVDVIVNAANTDLEAGTGVCGAIFKAAGEQLYAACADLSGCRTGHVKATLGFCLPARHIFHAVGPKKADDISLLAFCYSRSLDLAKTLHMRTIAFPCISTGCTVWTRHWRRLRLFTQSVSGYS